MKNDDDESRIVPSIKRVAEEATGLFTKEVALLKVELTNALQEARAGMSAIAIGGGILYGGFLCVLFAFVVGLSLHMDLWLAALVVGSTTLLIGAIVLTIGRRKVKPEAFKSGLTGTSLEKDREMIKEHTQEDSHDSYAR